MCDHGWKVLDRNWRSGHSEIDLVVWRDGVVAFVEVKTRAQRGSGHPLESITWKKRREVERVAASWLQARARVGATVDVVRFDAVAVELAPGRPPRVRHVEDAWRIGDG